VRSAIRIFIVSSVSILAHALINNVSAANFESNQCEIFSLTPLARAAHPALARADLGRADAAFLGKTAIAPIALS
jgi:hypothetical protein